MNAFIFHAAFLLLASVQEGRKDKDDVVQLKSGQFLVGRVQKIDADAVVILVHGDTQARRISAKDVYPYSLYALRLDRIDKKSAAARFELAEFCMTNGLYSAATREFDEAGKLDKALEEKAKKKRDEAHNEDARSKFEEAKKLHVEKKYEEANKILHLLLDRYDDTPYFDEARKEVAKIVEEIKKENEEKKENLKKKEEAKAAAEDKKKEDQEKFFFNKTLELIDEAQKAWLEGLDHEGKNSLTRADRAWKASEAALVLARRNVDQMLKSNDVDILKKAKEVDKQINEGFVKTYYRLGRMWAVELSYPTAIEWINKGLRVPHDEPWDRLLNEVLLTLTQMQMRKRAAGAGF